jgi:ferric-dicitrate binding protein FerR (iron transport regulator)
VGSTFPAGQRDVYLDGLGYFEVANDNATPFIVHAGGTTTRVLGTSFAVRQYAGDAGLRVVVASGRVAVGSAVLNAGDVAYMSDGVMRVTPDTVTSGMLAWTTGRIVFTATPLPEVVAELGRWYDVEFRIGKPVLATKVLTATFTNRTSDDVADAIAFSLGMRYEKQGQRITFYPQ